MSDLALNALNTDVLATVPGTLTIDPAAGPLTGAAALHAWFEDLRAEIAAWDPEDAAEMSVGSYDFIQFALTHCLAGHAMTLAHSRLSDDGFEAQILDTYKLPADAWRWADGQLFVGNHALPSDVQSVGFDDHEHAIEFMPENEDDIFTIVFTVN